MGAGETSSGYDALPYTEHAYAEAHPDRLAVVARLSGWTAPEVANARVLELGCARGGHLLPMAAQLPGARLVGVEPSRTQVDEARAKAGACGLSNVTLLASCFEDAQLEPGAFDYVVTHGLASWVAAETRRALLRTVAASLSPAGVAYVSFNALPGWYARMPARDWLRFAAGSLGLGGAEARASLSWLEGEVSPAEAAYRAGLQAVRARLEETDLAYLAHEHLAEEHHPLHAGELVREAAAAGLAYLGDAIPAEVAPELLGDAARARLVGLGVDAAQDLVDFVQNTSFRRALFVRADEAASRAWRWPERLDASAITGLLLAARKGGADAPAEPERVDGPRGSVHVHDPSTRRALGALAHAAPRSVPFAELSRGLAGEQRDLLGRELLDLWLVTGALELHAYEPPFASTPSERPRACPVARHHAEHGGPITNRWHQEVALAEPALRDVLRLADGTRTLAELARAAAWPGVSPAESLALAQAGIVLLARAALLEG